MHCIKCGKPLPPGAAFCGHCGAKQSGAAASPRGSGAWLPIASMVAGVAVLGGIGYFGWNTYSARQEAASKAAALEPSALKPVSDKAQPPLSPDEARERAETVAAQAALAKHIIEEENLAKTRAGVK